MGSSLATISSDSRLDRAWRGWRERSHTALVPFLSAGYPDRAASRDAIGMAAAHADVLEIGVPFSDPLADGPTIQAASLRALEGGMTLAGTLDLIAETRPTAPVVLFSYLNPILQYGLDRLLHDAADLGIAGLLLTDLPAGSDPALEHGVQSSPLDLIRLVAPTTTGARLREAVTGAQGFIYLVSRLGVTGASTGLAGDLGASVARVRGATTLPIAVGFGISTPEQAGAVAGLADGVVVGSALLDRIDQGGVAAGERFLKGLRSALDGG